MQARPPDLICTQPVSLTDLFCTLTELCGLPTKADVQSRSLVPLLRDPASHGRTPRSLISNIPRATRSARNTGGTFIIEMATRSFTTYKPIPMNGQISSPVSEHAAQLARLRALAPTPMAPVHETEPGISDFQANVLLDLIRPSAAKCPVSQPSTRKVTVLVRNQREAPFRLGLGR